MKKVVLAIALAASSLAFAQSNNPRDAAQPSTMEATPRKGPISKPIRLDSPEGRKLLSGCILRPQPPICEGLENLDGPQEITISWNNHKGGVTTISVTVKNPPK
jgi:hypothetical protein